MKKHTLKITRTTIHQLSAAEVAAVAGGSIAHCPPTVVGCPVHSNRGPQVCATDVCVLLP